MDRDSYISTIFARADCSLFRNSEEDNLDVCCTWAIKALSAAVDPLSRQRCLGYIGACMLVKGTEHVQNLFTSAQVSFPLLFSLSCVEVRMCLEKQQDQNGKNCPFLLIPIQIIFHQNLTLIHGFSFNKRI